MRKDKSIYSDLVEIGLQQRQAQMYIALLQRGPLTLVELSEITGLNRAALSRHAEGLVRLGLIDRLEEEGTTRLIPAEPEVLNDMLQSKLTEVESLRNCLKPLLSELSELSRTSYLDTTRVVHYRGVEGMRHQYWNMLKSDERGQWGVVMMDMNASVGWEFSERYRAEFPKLNIWTREISNEFYDFTKITKVKAYAAMTETKLYQSRMISRDIVDIRYDEWLYNDVTAIYYYEKGEYFGLEVHSKGITDTRREIFEVLWGLSKPKTAKD